MPQTVIDLLNKGSETSPAESFRQGNVVCLPAEGSVIITGDIHGHRRNFERILDFADLPNNPDRHIILQEIIHGGQEDSQGNCISYRLLFDAVRYKLNFPDRVHIIMGNHDTAFITDSNVMKNGKEMNRSMSLALEREFKQSSTAVKIALKKFLLSLPLAVRCENRIWMSHSLPANRYIDKFDKEVLEKKLKIDDCKRPGSAYLLTWGRNHSQSLLDEMAELLDIDIFILGHQAQVHGWSRAGENLIIIASDHNHGCLLPVDLAKSSTIKGLIDSIVPLASIS